MDRGSATSVDAQAALDRRARALERLIEQAADRPPRWRASAFVRQLGLVRSHLGPIRTRALLASSYGREAFRTIGADPTTDEPIRDLEVSPVHVAYAIRWLELGDGMARPDWLDLLPAGGEETMIGPTNRSNVRARRAGQLTGRRQPGRRAGGWVRAPAAVAGELAASRSPEDPSPAGEEHDAALWFGRPGTRFC